MNFLTGIWIPAAIVLVFIAGVLIRIGNKCKEGHWFREYGATIVTITYLLAITFPIGIVVVVALAIVVAFVTIPATIGYWVADKVIK